jgi:multiple sugar transport system substrate-binding protein
MFNGVADSIWSGTEHPEESWRWVKFLGSQEAQDIVGRFGVVFPAVESSVELALSAYETRGLDVSAFTEQATEPNGTFLFPITDNASEITQIMQETFDSIFLGRENAESALVRANRRINALFE